MHIETRGEGPDLVLIHGWAMHSGVFAPLSDLLAPHFRLHLVDLPGHGRSQGAVAGDLDPSVCAARILERTPSAIWLGWSLGGLISLRAALDAPAQVRGLVQIASSPRFVADAEWPHGVAADVFAGFARGLGSDYRATIERFLALETLGSPTANADLHCIREQVFSHGEPDLSMLEEGLDVLARSDLRAQLSNLAAPNVWIGGRRDRLVASEAMRWAAARAHGQYLPLDAGHAPFISHASLVADAVRVLERAEAIE